MKHYGLYDKKSTCFILGGMGFLYLLTFSLCFLLIRQFVFGAIAITGAPDFSIIPLLAIFIIPPFVIIPVVSRKSHALDRYLLRCTFCNDGIHCFGFLWKSFLIPWGSIRTYGMQGYSYSYASVVFLFFSTEREYYRKENSAKITTSRIVIQLRDEIIPPLFEFMPLDMKIKLEECIKESRDGYCQR